MWVNPGSHIIKQVVLPGIDEFLRDMKEGLHCAVAPLQYTGHIPRGVPHASIQYQSEAGTINLPVYTDNLQGTLRSELHGYLEQSRYDREVILSLLRKRHFTSPVTSHGKHCECHRQFNMDGEQALLLTFSIVDNLETGSVHIYLPWPFTRLITSQNAVRAGVSPEDAMKTFFRNTANIFPSLQLLLTLFTDEELQQLLYHLHTRNLLSTYQLCLMVRAFPSHALRVKHNLSRNVAGDVIDMMAVLERGSGISRRDMQAGVYSIEEALFMLLRQGEPVAYSRFLDRMQKTLTWIRCYELLEEKPFTVWLQEMQNEGLLYETTSILPDHVLGSAVRSTDEDMIQLLQKGISSRKLDDIISYSCTDRSPSASSLARCQVIRTYRYLRLTRTAANRPGLNFIKIINDLLEPRDIRHVLYDTGWFVLSTALKGIPSRTVNMYMHHLPSGARYLIEDVLKGILNPNILHDESQIRQARDTCASRIIQMHEDGIIRLRV